MLALLNISNIALIEELRVEFEPGLNLLTGETGSGKSIIVDALSVLIGGRFSSELLKAGEQRCSIEGLFSFEQNPLIQELLAAAGIETERGESAELIIRRELTPGGRNKIFINNQLATQSLLRELRPFLVDIHGQGDQQTLFDPETHIAILDEFAGTTPARQQVSREFARWKALSRELDEFRKDEAEKFQLIDTLRFQIDELKRAQLVRDEDNSLEEERRRLTSIEKLTTLCAQSLEAIYEDSDSAISRVKQTSRRIEELTEYDSSFAAYLESLESARVTLEDLALTLRAFAGRLEAQPERLGEIENRLAEISRLKRKYGGSIESALEHLQRSVERLQNIERSDERQAELRLHLDEARTRYLEAAGKLHEMRNKAVKKFERAVESALGEVAMDNSKFEVRIAAPSASQLRDDDSAFTSNGIDAVEFFFSANAGEPPKPLAKVASGGEASRLMLVLKTIAGASEFPRTIVFDEIDSGIGGRVSEAVGAKLKRLSQSNQVLCVTHQPQIARFADSHLLVRKEAARGRTEIHLDRLDQRGRVEEIARMLTGSEITESARRHAREMLKAG
jgi:DNA repair protein RecN (Recombination protein N)